MGWKRVIIYGLLGALVAALFSAAAFALVGRSIGDPAPDVLLPASAAGDRSRTPEPSRSPDDDPSRSDSPSPSPSGSEPGDDHGDDHGGDDHSGSGGGGSDDSSGHGSGDD